MTNLAFATIGAAFVWMFKRLMADSDRRHEASDRRQAESEQRIIRLEQNTVTKEDWLRETGIARQRQEKILEDMAELKGQNRAGVEIGAAIAAAINQRRGEQ